MLSWRKQLRDWMLRRLPLQQVVQLDHRRIYLLPTRMGWMLLLVAAAVWLGALNYAVSLAYALSFWIVSLLLLSVAVAFRQLQGVRVAVNRVHDALAGQDVAFHLDFSWAGQQARRLMLQHEDCLLPVPATGGELALAVSSQIRGVRVLSPLRLYSEAPLGLVRAYAYLRLQGQAHVYPVPLEDGWQAGMLGRSDGRTMAQGQDTVSHLARWQPAMGMRRIAWKHYAKRGELFARQLQGEQGDSPPLLIDWQAYPPQMAVEERLSRICWQLLSASHDQRAVTLRLPNRELNLPAGEARRGLRLLATFGVADAR